MNVIGKRHEMELSEAIAKVHESIEGRYTLDGYDLHEIHGILCEMQECVHPYAFVIRKVDFEKCTKCGKVLCEG